MKDFRSLSVWQKAHQLTLSIYGKTQAFPRDELYGLTSQLRRGSVSITSNTNLSIETPHSAAAAMVDRRQISGS